MSTTYLIYTEAKLNDEWRCIDGYCWFSSSKDKAEEKHLLTTYESGSRSYFGDTYDKLRHIGFWKPYSELSKEVREAHPRAEYECSFTTDDNKKEEAVYLTVPIKDFDAAVPDGFQYHGVFHKDSIYLYEKGEIEELYTDDSVNLKKLPKEERKCYQYYEYDSVFDWPYWFKILKRIKDETVGKYFRNNYTYYEELPPLRFVVMTF